MLRMERVWLSRFWPRAPFLSTKMVDQVVSWSDDPEAFSFVSVMVCHFRSQHRYCSNLYPKAGTYEVCNWCLTTQNEDSGNLTRKVAAQNSSDSNSSQNKAIENDPDNSHTKRSRKSTTWKPGLHLQVGGNGNRNDKVKKAAEQPEMSPPTTLRMRIITWGALEEKLHRPKSEKMANRGSIPRQVFRNKVRRYKLADEVSS